jgi:hypothetical protein
MVGSQVSSNHGTVAHNIRYSAYIVYCEYAFHLTMSEYMGYIVT